MSLPFNAKMRFPAVLQLSVHLCRCIGCNYHFRSGCLPEIRGYEPAVITELPLVVLNVQRGGPSTGLPTKSEQTDLLQALFGRNGESPMPVIAATSPTNCFDAAYAACKMALEHMTPVVLLTDGFVANGSGSWKLPNLDTYPEIKPQYVTPEMKDNYTPYKRNPENGTLLGHSGTRRLYSYPRWSGKKTATLVRSLPILKTTI